MPGTDWAGDWYGYYLFASFMWSWNLPSKLIPALVVDAMGKDAPADGMLHESGDYALFHSVLMFDAVTAHLRFDGLSSLRLVEEIGRICDFQPGECRICWAGSLPSLVVSSSYVPTASWKILDSVSGLIKEGRYNAEMLNNPAYKRPSDLVQLNLLSA